MGVLLQRRDRHLTKADRQKERLDARAFKVGSPVLACRDRLPAQYQPLRALST